MLHQIPIIEDVFLTIIFLIASFVFGIIMLMAVLIRRSAAKRQNEFRPEEKNKSRPRGTAGITSGTIDQAALPKNWGRLTGIADWALIFGLLLVAEFALQSALHRGWTTYPTKPSSLSVLTVDNEGRVWALEEKGMIHYPEQGSPVRIRLPHLTEDSVLSVAFDGQNRLWVRTSNGRLGIGDGNHQWSFYNPESLEGPVVGPVILVDVKGQAWTNTTELARIELDTVNSIYRLVTAGPGIIDTLAIDPKGQLWALTAMGELKKLDLDDRWVTITTIRKQDPDVNWAFTPFGPAHLFIDQQGQVWIGEGNGIVHRLGTDGVLHTYAPNEPHPAIYLGGIVADHEGDLWGVSGYQGLYRFHPETGWTAYNPRNSRLSSHPPEALAVNGNGRVWFGSYSAGLARMDPAEALPAQYIPLLGSLGAIVIPAGLLSIIAAALAAMIPARAWRKPDRKPPDSRKIMLGAFGAAFCGLYVLGQREMFAILIMETILGEHWSHGDFFAMIVAPLLSICLVPLAGIMGAAMGVFVLGLFLRVVHRDQMSSP